MSSEPRRIRPLPDHLINQIAAGEVIERPVSVVKELVENSIDAGAARVDVELEDGGLSGITVIDDGGGLAGEELVAALRRHWTSKLADGADLARIATLGFRGEALASIAAVATVDIVSRRRGDAHGWRVTVNPGGEPSTPVPQQAPAGTRVAVRELFYNVPARKRFLKRGRTEYLHVLQLLRRVAFACPRVALTLSQPGSRGLRLRPAELGVAAPRWRSVFGAAFADAAALVDAVTDDMRVTGWLGGADLASSQSDVQMISLNGRPIRDRQLAHAVRLAYGERLAPGRFPMYALALSLALDAVDVNVHPGKLEVRFLDLRRVHDFVVSAVRRVLEPALAPRLPAAAAPARLAETATTYVPAPGAAHATPHVADIDLDAVLGRPLALVDERFLLAQRGQGTWILDLRAVWTKVLTRRLAGDTGATRSLLIPERVPPPLVGCVRASAPAFESLGFAFDDFGAAGLVLRGVPAILPPLASARLLECLPAKGGPIAPHSVASAAAATLVLGEHGRPSHALLEALVRAANAAGVVLEGEARLLTGAALLDALDERR